MYEEFQSWEVSEKLAFWGVVVALFVGILPYINTIFVRNKKLLEIRLEDVKILVFQPKDNEIIPVFYHERIIERYIKGQVKDLSKKQIKSLGLRVQVRIKTDNWYIQDADDGDVSNDGTWKTKIFFGEEGIGKKHIIEISLTDKFGRTGTPIKLMVQPER